MISGLSNRPATHAPTATLPPGHPVVAYYQTILNRLSSTRDPTETLGRTLGITSCALREGVTTVATNLALVAAAECPDRQVLLVDTNWDRPAVQREFQTPLAPGMTEVLLETCDLADAIRPSPLANLSLLTSGANASLLTGQQEVARTRELLERLEMQFDMIVLDLPAATRASRALPLAGLVDGVLLVIGAEHIAWESAQQTARLLTQSRAQLLGVVLNKQRKYIPDWIYRRI